MNRLAFPTLILATVALAPPALAAEGKGEVEFQDGRARNRRVEIVLTGGPAGTF